jgi:deoxyribodipyrimidine photolyase-related protein
LDFSLKKSIEWGYCHHIERLMVIGNFMMLLEVHPQQVYRWFMEMYVDSSDWVMGANVFGMSQFSDGGIFATKPYICGSNYLIKMSHYKKGDWCDAVDGLYWQFIDRHRDFFKTNHRMSMMVSSVDKMDPSRKKQIYQAANKLKERLTIE